MSSEQSDIHTGEEAHEGGMSKARIVRVAVILTIITCIEFVIALFLVPRGILTYHMANPLYILLTLAKAFFIVAYFMHLKFEKLSMIYIIIIPIVFIIGLILVLTNESHHWFDLRS